METIKPVFGPMPDKESHKLKIEIDADENGLWYTKFTCPLCPEYIQIKWADGTYKLKTVPEVHHWFSGTYTKHLEKN